MRVFIETLGGNKFPLEVESFDTIDYVKTLIREKEGTRASEQTLIWEGKRLRDNSTLADYNIQNDSTIDICPRLWGGWHVLIKTFPEKRPFSLMASLSQTINDVKAQIEGKMGIPVNGQRLMFFGKELDDGGRTLKDYGIVNGSTLRLVRLRGAGDDAVDIAALQARKKAAIAKAKEEGIENQPEVGSKSGFSSLGANRVEGVESFWDEEDFGLAWRKSRSLISPYDTVGFESKSRRTLAESVANDCVRTLNVTAFLESQLQEHEDRLSLAEKEVKRLTDENGDMMEEVKKLMQELVAERSKGVSFLQSEAGRRHIVTLERQAAKSAVEEFQKGAVFNEIVTNRSMSIYDDVVKECQRLLRKSGRVSEDIIQLIDALDSDKEEKEGKKVDSKKLKQELDVERSTGVSFLQSEVGRRHIVTLQRQAAKSAVEEFQKGAVFNEIVMNRAMSVYDDVVKECQRLLRESGRVSEDIIQLLDHSQDSNHGEDEDKDENEDEHKDE